MSLIKVDRADKTIIIFIYQDLRQGLIEKISEDGSVMTRKVHCILLCEQITHIKLSFVFLVAFIDSGTSSHIYKQNLVSDT